MCRRDRMKRLPDLAAELVRLKVDLIVTIAGATRSPCAPRRRPATIPIVAVAVVRSRRARGSLRASRGRAETSRDSHIDIQRAGREAAGTAQGDPARVSLAWRSSGMRPTRANVLILYESVQAAARTTGREASIAWRSRGPDDFEAAFAEMSSERADALIDPGRPSSCFATDASIVDFAAKKRLPGRCIYSGNRLKPGDSWPTA